MKKKILYSLGLLGIVLSLGVGCGSKEVQGDASSQKVSSEEKKSIKFGTCPGPYGDMIKYAIQPALEEKGYEVQIVEFSDYVQPNVALGKGEVDANLFQHSVYFENFKEEHNLDLTNLINVPTVGLGIYSNKYTDLSQVENGATFTVPNDVTNMRRALREAQKAGLLTIDEEADVAKFSEKDIKENPLNLVVTGVEAAQLPRTLDSADIVAIPGNYALSAGIDLETALYKEVLDEELKNIIAIQTKDKDAQFVKDIKEVVESEAFKDVIESDQYAFKSFQKPDWYKEKWQIK